MADDAGEDGIAPGGQRGATAASLTVSGSGDVMISNMLDFFFWQVVASDQAVLGMDDLGHKLRQLKYDVGFCAAKDIPPFNRLYFALPQPGANAA
jgi:hypothetical protein